MICADCGGDFSPNCFPIDKLKYNKATKSFARKEICKTCTSRAATIKYRTKKYAYIVDGVSYYGRSCDKQRQEYKNSRKDTRTYKDKYMMTTEPREVVGWNGDDEIYL